MSSEQDAEGAAMGEWTGGHTTCPGDQKIEVCRLCIEEEIAEERTAREAAESDRDAATARAEALEAAGRAFVEHHDNGQAGQPGFPRTYGEQAAWLVEWDRRIDALRALLGPEAPTTGREGEVQGE